MSFLKAKTVETITLTRKITPVTGRKGIFRADCVSPGTHHLFGREAVCTSDDLSGRGKTTPVDCWAVHVIA